MKKRTKVLALLGCAVMLVVGSVMGTMAYLTYESTVTNTFTVGKVSFGDGNGKGALDEAAVDAYGVKLYKGNSTTEFADRVQTNEYKLIPNHTYVKDPIIHIAEESEECYLYVEVKNGISEIEAATDTTGEDPYTNIAEQMENNGWTLLDETNYPGIYVYDGTKSSDGKVAGLAVNKGTNDIPIFEEFKIKEDVEAKDTVVEGVTTKKGLESFTNAKIEITAYAVQADGFDSASDAWKDTFGKSSSSN